MEVLHCRLFYDVFSHINVFLTVYMPLIINMTTHTYQLEIWQISQNGFDITVEIKTSMIVKFVTHTDLTYVLY